MLATSNGQNPSFPGNVQGLTFSSPWGIALTKAIAIGALSGAINVFGTTNGFGGTLLGIRTTSGESVNGIIDLTLPNGTYIRIIKGSAGVVNGSFFKTGTADGVTFTPTGTMTVSNNGSSNALVELIFTTRETIG